MPSIVKWVEALAVMSAAGAADTTNGSLVSLLDASGKFTLPANYFDRIGKGLRFTAKGIATSISTSGGGIPLAVRFGAISVWAQTTGIPTSSITNGAWLFELNLICRAIGAGTSANLYGVGKFTFATAALTQNVSVMPISSPAVGSGFDSTVSQAVDFQANLTTSTGAGNFSTMTCHEYILESLN